MGNTLYLECFAGISGDMTVGCLLDLGADQEKLQRALEGLQLEGFEIVISRVKKSGLDMCDFAVLLDEAHENHDHDMGYLHKQHEKEEDSHRHGHEGEQGLKNIHEHNFGSHRQEHSMEQHHNQNSSHAHVHRGLLEIIKIIQEAQISERAKEIAVRIFDIISEAEAKAHGVSKEQVHFHEVGAIDSIVDIIAVAVCLDDLNITDVIVPSLCEGRGMVRCQHGMMPIPVPAVTEIVSRYQLTLESVDVEGEFITPTGAAIVAAVKTADALPKHYKICAVGMGAGKRSYTRPSILRGMLIEEAIWEDKEEWDRGFLETENANGLRKAAMAEGQIWKLESNIDDTTGEGMGYIMEQLIKHGARDVYYIPVYMKKNRPSYLLNVICEAKQIAILESMIFENTTTIGIRKYPVARSVLPRQVFLKETSFGMAAVKECVLPDGKKRLYPEYESIKKICHEKNLPYWEVYQQLLCEL